MRVTYGSSAALAQCAGARGMPWVHEFCDVRAVQGSLGYLLERAGTLEDFNLARLLSRTPEVRSGRSTPGAPGAQSRACSVTHSWDGHAGTASGNLRCPVPHAEVTVSRHGSWEWLSAAEMKPVRGAAAPAGERQQGGEGE